ncbi:MAG: YkoF family thiamine/hydroxymethylpyrimidine-binding protein [Saprospiraceae bacterium]
MQISVEISMYPLDAEYEKSILAFIQHLRTYPNIKVETNVLSTQIFGAYDEVFTILQKEIKRAFEDNERVVMVSKIVNLGLSEG